MTSTVERIIALEKRKAVVGKFSANPPSQALLRLKFSSAHT
jgi:hypothetical protein